MIPQTETQAIDLMRNGYQVLGVWMLEKKKIQRETRHYSMRENSWTPEEDEVLLDNYEHGDLALIGTMLKRTESAMSKRAYKLGIVRKRKKSSGDKAWKSEEYEYLIEHYNYKDVSRIALLLNRTEATIMTKVKYLREKGLMNATT